VLALHDYELHAYFAACRCRRASESIVRYHGTKDSDVGHSFKLASVRLACRIVIAYADILSLPLHTPLFYSPPAQHPSCPHYQATIHCCNIVNSGKAQGHQPGSIQGVGPPYRIRGKY